MDLSGLFTTQSVIDILKLGPIGIGFLLGVLAFYQNMNLQKILVVPGHVIPAEIVEATTSLAKRYMNFCLVCFGFAAVVTLGELAMRSVAGGKHDLALMLMPSDLKPDELPVVSMNGEEQSPGSKTVRLKIAEKTTLTVELKGLKEKLERGVSASTQALSIVNRFDPALPNAPLQPDQPER